MDKKQIEKTLIGSKINEIARAVNMLIIGFDTLISDKIKLHAQCYVRIFELDKLILSSENLYTPSKKFKKRLFKKFNYTKVGDTLFDDIISSIKEKIFSSKIQKVLFNNNDLQIILYNNMIIEILVNVSEHDDKNYCENYRIFKKGDTEDHFEI